MNLKASMNSSIPGQVRAPGLTLTSILMLVLANLYASCAQNGGQEDTQDIQQFEYRLLYITAPKVLTCWTILHVEASSVSCGVAEASDVSFSLALLAESHLPRSL